MLKKVLITGITGFAGSHLAEYLLSQNKYDISGTYLSQQSLSNVSAFADKLHLIHVDLKNKDDVSSLVKKAQPDFVFHLAALPAVGGSSEKSVEVITNNVAAQVNLLDAIRQADLHPRILIVSSSEVYGKVSKEDLPIDEETKFYPTNAYAVSKITQDYLGLQYVIAYNLQIIRVRPFNHIGPRQAPGFVVADWSEKIAQIEKGNKEPILQVGNIESKRDFTDVRDMVRAYALLIENGKVGDVYNIGSGIAYKISDILAMMLSLSSTKITTTVDSSLLRQEDFSEHVCDNSKLCTLTGWKPEISIEQTLKDTLDYWRNIV